MQQPIRNAHVSIRFWGSLQSLERLLNTERNFFSRVWRVLTANHVHVFIYGSCVNS